MFHPLRPHLDDFHDRWQIQLILFEFDRGNRSWRRIVKAVYWRLRVRLFAEEVLDVLIRHGRVEVVKGRGFGYLRGKPNAWKAGEVEGSQEKSEAKQTKEVGKEKLEVVIVPEESGGTAGLPESDQDFRSGMDAEVNLDENSGRKVRDATAGDVGESRGAVVVETPTQKTGEKSGGNVYQAAAGDIAGCGSSQAVETKEADPKTVEGGVEAE